MNTGMPPLAGGFFLTLEGIEGAGKSSAVPVLMEWCHQQGYAVEVTREPGGGPLGEALRPIFLDDRLQLGADEELLLLYAGRRNHWLTRIAPALAAGKVLISDRYEDSTYAYQGGGRGVPSARIAELARWTGITRQPDLTFWFDVPPELGAARIRARHPDRMEREDREFFTRARGVFAERCAAEPQRIARIDATQPLALVHDALRARLAVALTCHR
ncbi:dTMP kinase [Acidithiobacillus ferrianus]|uniref:dTMP kinase n=2 Tax=Acidithiobacillus ferrianus TaxID=2678518 RepID=A0ACD5H431_9PROT|nr:dTMP kinase [Acidithiobacillus ferrianus]